MRRDQAFDDRTSICDDALASRSENPIVADGVILGKNAMADLNGGRLCGRVRYTVTGEPAFSGLCHCRNCQRYTGSAFEPFVAMPTESVSTTGELKTFEHAGGSGRPVHRCFCPNCGS